MHPSGIHIISKSPTLPLPPHQSPTHGMDPMSQNHDRLMGVLQGSLPCQEGGAGHKTPLMPSLTDGRGCSIPSTQVSPFLSVSAENNWMWGVPCGDRCMDSCVTRTAPAPACKSCCPEREVPVLLQQSPFQATATPAVSTKALQVSLQTYGPSAWP